MSDRRPENPTLEDALVTVDTILSLILHRHNIDPPLSSEERRRALLAIDAIRRPDFIAVVRRGVESGTIKGTEIGVFPTFEGDHVIEIPGQRKKRLADELEPGTYLVIPVSDGGVDS